MTMPTSRLTCQGPTRLGFMLMELILALTITAIVGVALFASLDIALDTRRRATDRLAGRNAARITLEVIAGDLRGVPSSGGLLAGSFIGDDRNGADGSASDTLNFTTNHSALPTYEERSDRRRIWLALADDPDDPHGSVLRRDVTTNLLASTVPDPVPQILARGVRSLNFRFFDGVDWYDSWNSNDRDNQRPIAVEVTLSLLPLRGSRRRTGRTTDHDPRDCVADHTVGGTCRYRWRRGRRRYQPRQ